MKSQRFSATVAAVGRGSLLVPVPFDPNEVWGAKRRHHVAGTVNGVRVRAVIEPFDDGFGFTLDFEGILTQLCADIQAAFKQTDILIPSAEKAFNAAANLNCGFHLFGARPPEIRLGSAKHQAF